MSLDSLASPACVDPVYRPDGPVVVAAAAAAAADESLLALGNWLRDRRYHFVCPSPDSHARVLERAPEREGRSLADVFGWNLPFHPDLLPACVTRWLKEAGALSRRGMRLRSGVRFSSVGAQLFVHSSYPMLDPDAVFFGPDTYRFARFVDAALAAHWPCSVRSLVDIGCGAGAGAILAARALGRRDLRRRVLRDANPRALRYAATNVDLNDAGPCEFSGGDPLEPIEDRFDLVVANVPYTIGEPVQHGGRDAAAPGVDLALRALSDAVAQLAPRGRILLYTGAPVVDGQDVFRRAASELLERAGLRHRYSEIDPDVFGEALDRPAYARVDRIAAIGLEVSRLEVSRSGDR